MRALLTDPDAEVQWIFMQRSLGASLLREAAAAGDDPALLARAAYIIHEPSDSEPHDDHMHVRFYCDPGDRRFGCADRGPVRWWKKMWKYMEAPYGRAPVDALGGDERRWAVRDECRRSVGGELTAAHAERRRETAD